MKIKILFILFIFIFNISNINAETDVNINTAVAKACILNFTVIPEKRINNYYANLLTIELFSAEGDFIHYFDTESDANGLSQYNFCENKVYLPYDTYNFYIQGYSHLRKSFPNIMTFEEEENYIDFSTYGYLYAGETSVIFDNKINSLDVSRQINTFFSNDIKNDLNRDGKVNSLDISNMAYNFLMSGD